MKTPEKVMKQAVLYIFYRRAKINDKARRNDLLGECCDHSRNPEPDFRWVPCCMRMGDGGDFKDDGYLAEEYLCDTCRDARAAHFQANELSRKAGGALRSLERAVNDMAKEEARDQ